MKPERWQRIERLYHRVLEYPPDQRTTFLEEACDGDQALRQDVESLLLYDERAAHFITSPPHKVAAEMLAVAPPHSLLGNRLGPYQMLSHLGQGGMGEVYLAQDMRLGRKVAIKMLPAQFTADAARVWRFEQEARAASALNHPNIITVHDIGEVEGIHYIVNEYVDGETLRQRMTDAPQRMEIDDALDIAAQMATALATAHEAGIVHRDIKPENVMVRPDGLVKVLDFGLAKLTEQPAVTPEAEVDSQAPTLARLSTEPGIVMGTVSYMSPEQARGLRVDPRTDIFSLGVMLYEMLAGQRPFVGTTAGETIAAILRDEPQPLSQHHPDCPATLEGIVSRCLAKTPEQRYQTSGELSAALKAACASIKQGSRPTTATAEEEKLAAFQRAEKSKNQRQRWAAIGGVIVLLALIAAFSYFQAGRDTVKTAIKTIAVLPPRPLKSDERDEALEMGTTSILITRLGSLRQLIVRPESAVERYARPDQDPLAAGREQKVDAVLDSRYQRSGDKFRFTLRLLRVADGATLWADTLDQQAADLFAVEDALSAKVTSALGLTLSGADKGLLAKRYTNSAEAWQLYARGHHLLFQRRVPDVEKAITYFQRAIAIDNNFALAHAELGHSYASLNHLAHSPTKEVMPKAKAAYDQALKLDDQLAEAHSFLACYKIHYEWDFIGAKQDHLRAINLDPNSAEVHGEYGFYLVYWAL
jgi:eukaryotic-like serine/threonine-protein kinase